MNDSMRVIIIVWKSLSICLCTVPKLVGLPDINYSGLQWLCSTQGLGGRYVTGIILIL